MRRLSLILTVGILALTACDPPPLSGVVEHKSYSAAYTYFTYPCIAYNSKGYCTAYGLIINQMPARWTLCVKGPNKNGKVVSDCWDTDPVDYGRYTEGDRWPK